MTPWEQPRIALWATKYGTAWPAPDNGMQRATLATIGDALTTRYATDAHFCQYESTRRLSIDAPKHAGRAPHMRALVVDLDAPDKRRTEAWDDALRRACESLSGSPCGYYTANGARLVWLCDGVSVEQWGLYYTRALIDLYTRAALLADPACADWTRLFRLPFGVRDGVPQDHGWVCGDPYDIGQYQPHTSEREQAAAHNRLAATSPQWARAIERLSPRPRPKPSTPPPSSRLGSADRAIEHATYLIESAGKGERNSQLYAQSCFLRKVALDKRLDETDVKTRLLQAALAAGLDEREARGVIRSAFRR